MIKIIKAVFISTLVFAVALAILVGIKTPVFLGVVMLSTAVVNSYFLWVGTFAAFSLLANIFKPSFDKKEEVTGTLNAG